MLTNQNCAGSKQGDGGGSRVADDDDAGLGAGTLSKSEAEESLGVLFGDEILTGLQSVQWKERLSAMETILNRVPEMKENLDSHVSGLIQAMAFLPGWSEKNFQVCPILLQNLSISRFMIETGLVKDPSC